MMQNINKNAVVRKINFFQFDPSYSLFIIKKKFWSNSFKVLTKHEMFEKKRTIKKVNQKQFQLICFFFVSFLFINHYKMLSIILKVRCKQKP